MAALKKSEEIASTALPEEVARFAAISDKWWDAGGPFKPLHKFNPVRLAYMRAKLCDHFGRDPKAARPFEGLRLLDVGCGGGLISEPMARMGFDVTGVDAAEKNIGVARYHAEQAGLKIDYRATTPEQMRDDRGQFDVVLSLEVVEHVADVDQFLGAAADLAKPGAPIFAATLNRTAKSFALAIVGAEYVLRWLPRGTHDWRKFLKPSELSGHLRRNGIELRDISGFTFNPFRDEWKVTKDLDVNYIVFGVKSL